MSEHIQTRRILLIDDDEDEHYIFKEALQSVQYTYQYSVANGWQQAEKILSNIKPDIIFLDLNLPGKNGLECLKEIKQKKELQSIPVYLYSTGISDADCKTAVHIGAADCIKKTGTIKELSNVLADILIH